MLLKYIQYQRRSKLGVSAKPQRTAGSRLVSGKGGLVRRGAQVNRKTIHRNTGVKRSLGGEAEEGPALLEGCDNSNDSGFDQAELHHQIWEEEIDRVKRARSKAVPPQSWCEGSGGKGKGRRGGGVGRSVSRDGSVVLEILAEPEGQHRARYQTEGSRGAVKDTTGHSFPVVKLTGYSGVGVLEVYIGTDEGKVGPHMFYQACKVQGKNSTPCNEITLNGTVLIQIEFDPANDHIITCDCVGILKERNVDVEQRFPEESSPRNKKKSTRCRMVFRTSLSMPDGSIETLQVTSQPIVCTQPAGVPEICKKSLSRCEACGGAELFVLGKNLLKDSKVVFSEGEPSSPQYWTSVVQPDKDFLQQSHLVCVVPPYKDLAIKEAVSVRVQILSGGKLSESHSFAFTPVQPSFLPSINQDLPRCIGGRNDVFGPSPLLQLKPPQEVTNFISQNQGEDGDGRKWGGGGLKGAPLFRHDESSLVVKEETELTKFYPGQAEAEAESAKQSCFMSIPSVGREEVGQAEPLCVGQSLLNLGQGLSGGVESKAESVAFAESGPILAPHFIGQAGSLMGGGVEAGGVCPMYSPPSTGQPHFAEYSVAILPPTDRVSLDSALSQGQHSQYMDVEPVSQSQGYASAVVLSESLPTPLRPDLVLSSVGKIEQSQFLSDQLPPPVQPTISQLTVPNELTQMSENDLISYINPSCFDQV